MKIVKAQVYEVLDDENLVGVVVDNEGRMHIAKLPFDKDNIFFSVKEIEAVVDNELVLKTEFEIEDLTPQFIEWKNQKEHYEH